MTDTIERIIATVIGIFVIGLIGIFFYGFIPMVIG